MYMVLLSLHVTVCCLVGQVECIMAMAKSAKLNVIVIVSQVHVSGSPIQAP